MFVREFSIVLARNLLLWFSSFLMVIVSVTCIVLFVIFQLRMTVTNMVEVALELNKL